MKKEDLLISHLIQSMFGINDSDSSYKSIYDYTNKYLRDNSMLYIPKPKEIEAKVIALAEKLEINTQFEKSKLLLDYISRLKMIFEKKTPIQNEFLFNAINLVIQLAHSPLINTRNVDMMRELFESRYIRNEYNKIIKTKSIPEDLEIIQTVYFDKIDYDEKTDSESSENEKVEEENHKEEKKKTFEVNIDNRNLNRSKSLICNTDDFKTITQSILIKSKNDTAHLLFNRIKKLFVHQQYFIKMPLVFFDHLMNINQRDTKLYSNTNSLIDSDYVLNRVLHLMSLPDEISTINTSFFSDRFSSLYIVDMSTNLFRNIISAFKEQRTDISSLRNIRQIFERNNIDSIIISKLSSLIHLFTNIHDIIIDRLMKVIYYQKGKIENIKGIYSKVLFIDSSIALSKEDCHLIFLNSLIAEANCFISLSMSTKSKLTLLKVLNFYHKHFQPICSYFITLIEEIISTKQLLVSLNKYTTSLLIKDLFDKMYFLCRNNQILNMEVFICLIEVYIKFIYEFIINGNMIDSHNEFFIDHLFTKDELKKFIFCFNKKYQIFDWVDCFKIKHSSINNYEGACVPLVFMNNHLYFKILETGKTTFLLKNLKVTSYIDNNKELLFKERVDYAKCFIINPLEKLSDNSCSKIDNETNAISIPIDEFDELKRLNETLKISKAKMEGLIKEAPAFGEDRKSNHVNGNGSIVNFDSNKRYIELNEDIEMKDSTSPLIIINRNIIKAKEEEQNDYIEEDNEMITHKRIIAREDDQEMKAIYNMLLNKNDNKASNQQKKAMTKNGNYESLYNIDIILSHLFFNHIVNVNKEINTKFLGILNDNLNLHEHFNLMLHLFLFKAGFSMNKFISELNAFIFNQAKQVNKISIDHSYYLKNTLIELSSNLGSDLRPYKEKIENNLQVTFKEDYDLLFHSNVDLIFMDYQPGLPISIFFDKSIIAYYNAVFNYIVKIKRTLILIRDIALDKQIKAYIGMIPQQKCIIKNFIHYRMMILAFASNLEFFIFHFVVNYFIDKFIQKSISLSSIDQYINSHSRFIKNIYIFLGLNNAVLMKKTYKMLNLIISFHPFLNRFLLVNDFDDKAIEQFYMEIINAIEKFKRKEKKINEALDILREKIFLQ